MPQAEALDAHAGRAAASKLDHVLVLDAPDEELVTRIAGRRTCPSCQATYHVVAKPPRVRRRLRPLRQRRSSSAATTPRRSSATACASTTRKTRPVLDYFEQAKWPVRRIDAVGNMDQIFGRIYAAVLLS